MYTGVTPSTLYPAPWETAHTLTIRHGPACPRSSRARRSTSWPASLFLPPGLQPGSRCCCLFGVFKKKGTQAASPQGLHFSIYTRSPDSGAKLSRREHAHMHAHQAGRGRLCTLFFIDGPRSRSHLGRAVGVSFHLCDPFGGEFFDFCDDNLAGGEYFWKKA